MTNSIDRRRDMHALDRRDLRHATRRKPVEEFDGRAPLGAATPLCETADLVILDHLQQAPALSRWRPIADDEGQITYLEDPAYLEIEFAVRGDEAA